MKINFCGNVLEQHFAKFFQENREAFQNVADFRYLTQTFLEDFVLVWLYHVR